MIYGLGKPLSVKIIFLIAGIALLRGIVGCKEDNDDRSELLFLAALLQGQSNCNAIIARHNLSASNDHAMHADPYRAMNTTPDDSDFNNLWGLNNTEQFNGNTTTSAQNQDCTGSDCYDMDAPQGWDTVRDCGTVVVAVLDSGVNYNHEDLSSNMWTADSGERGCDLVDADTDPMDENRHGTHNAGIIGAIGNNSKESPEFAGMYRSCPCVFSTQRVTVPRPKSSPVSITP